MPTLNLDVFSKSSWNENEKKKKIIETDSHWTTKESGADRKGEMQHCGWYCFNLCVCVCDMPSLHSVFLVLPFLMSHCLCFLFFFNLCVVCVCVCLGIALHSCPFNQLTSSTNQAPVAFCGSLWIVHSLMWVQHYSHFWFSLLLMLCDPLKQLFVSVCILISQPGSCSHCLQQPGLLVLLS